MPALLFLAFVGIPIVEIAILIRVGQAVGLWPTLGLIVATAAFGTWMLRVQGLGVLARAQASLAEQRFPAREVFDGLCLVFAGALLLTPGFVTDSVGLALLIPPFRAMLRRSIFRWMRRTGRIHVVVGGFDGSGGPGEEGEIIEGEYEEVDPDRPVRRSIPRRKR